jgi:hypothetical protein
VPLLEALASLCHDEWVYWTKQLDYLPDSVTSRWKPLWTPYDNLPEEVKEEDRVWARKFIVVLKRYELKLEAITA